MKSKFFALFTILLIVLVGCSNGYKKYDDGVFFGELDLGLNFKSATKKSIQRRTNQIEESRRIMKKLGLTEDVELIQLGKEKRIEGKFEGGFLSGSSGEIGSFSVVIFRWKASDGRSFFAELPLDKVGFEDSREDPLIRFVFHVDPFYGWDEDLISEQQELFLKKPTTLVNSENIFFATIKISEEGMGKYLSLR